jgi:hypothetical protein
LESGEPGLGLSLFDPEREEPDTVLVDVGPHPWSRNGDPALLAEHDEVVVAWARRDPGGLGSIRLRRWVAGVAGLEPIAGNVDMAVSQSSTSAGRPRLASSSNRLWASWLEWSGHGVRIRVSELLRPDASVGHDPSRQSDVGASAGPPAACTFFEGSSVRDFWLLPGSEGPRVAVWHERPLRVGDRDYWIQVLDAAGSTEPGCESRQRVASG